jgi:hypothetical protein
VTQQSERGEVRRSGRGERESVAVTDGMGRSRADKGTTWSSLFSVGAAGWFARYVRSVRTPVRYQLRLEILPVEARSMSHDFLYNYHMAIAIFPQNETTKI